MSSWSGAVIFVLPILEREYAFSRQRFNTPTVAKILQQIQKTTPKRTDLEGLVS